MRVVTFERPAFSDDLRVLPLERVVASGGHEFSELTPQELSEVFGGTGATKAVMPDVCKTPSPGGPIPIPYPNCDLLR